MFFREKRFLALALAGAMTIALLSGCSAKKPKESYEKIDEEDETVYTIGISQSVNEEFYDQITKGFRDSISDYFGDSHIEVKYELASDEKSPDDIAYEYINSGVQLIFANGESALSSAAMSTDTLPIVGAGVIDYQTTLHIADDGWGSKTGTNVTGISSRPPIAAQLSLLIESTPRLETVGILYSPDDSDAIYQNEILEGYLNQAGIPWKEYELASTEEAKVNQEETLETEKSGSAISPNKVVAPSSSEGVNNFVFSLGEASVITGLLSDKSVRTAKTSVNWPDVGKYVSLELEEGEDIGYERIRRATLSDGDDNEDIVKYACDECSALFISSSSMLNDQMEMICGIATDMGVTTTGADTSISDYTLTTLYSDPYDMGYRAGKLAYRILVNETEPGTIKITGVDVDDSLKLYQASVAEKFNMEFPKSFTEVKLFMEEYTPGDNTSRVNQE